MDDSGHTAIGNAAFVLALRERGVRDTAVLRAMEQIPREHFAPEHLRGHARRDIALPLPCGQTMTAPMRIATMLVALGVPPAARVLEVGTGSGYVTALLARLGASEIRSLDRYATLAESAQARLVTLGLEIAVEAGDGLDGAGQGDAVYDRILLNGLCPALGSPLKDALAPGGRLVCAIDTPEGPCLLTLDRAAGGEFVERIGPPLRLSALRAGRARVL